MGDAVSLQDVPIVWTQDGGIPHLDGVGRAGRQMFSESVELVEKPGWFQPPALKLKDEGAELRAQLFHGRFQNEIAKGVGVKKSRIGLAGLRRPRNWCRSGVELCSTAF